MLLLLMPPLLLLPGKSRHLDLLQELPLCPSYSSTNSILQSYMSDRTVPRTYQSIKASPPKIIVNISEGSSNTCQHSHSVVAVVPNPLVGFAASFPNLSYWLRS